MIVGTANNGRSAIALAEEFDPDIAFLDIHMPGLSGLQVAEALPANTKIVFVTAYDEFAVKAFQHAAVDYLLKPVTNARLGLTIERLKNSPSHQDRSVLMQFLQAARADQKNYLQWIRAGYDDTTQLIAAEDVIYFKADHKYTEVITKESIYVVRRSIKELGEELDPAQFWQIHRGIIVRVDQVAAALNETCGDVIQFPCVIIRIRCELARVTDIYSGKCSVDMSNITARLCRNIRCRFLLCP